MAKKQEKEKTPLEREMAAVSELVYAELDDLLAEADVAEHRLIDAMRYATLAPGKRLRPFIVIESAKLFGIHQKNALRVAAALEMVHCYALVHDDLPSMDDDDYRRGQPACHKKFDEATAIIAGNALLTKAFEVLSDEKTHIDPTVRCELVLELAKAAGNHGMCAGQMLDLIAVNLDMSMDLITRLQRQKTGELFSFAAQSGAILAGADEPTRNALQSYAYELGLAFQITDDLLDTNQDTKEKRITFVSLMGKEKALRQAETFTKQASEHLKPFGAEAVFLRELAQFILKRKS